MMYKVLLADDEYMIINGLRKLIPWESLGYEVVGTARNGLEALEFIRQEPVDLVVLDVNMPIMSGIEFLEQAKKSGCLFRSIMLSGYQEFQYVKDTLNLGTENYLLKPVNKVEMIETLNRVAALIEEDRQQEQQQDYLQAYFLVNWLHDEVDYDALEGYLAKQGINVAQENFTVVFIDRPENETAIKEYLLQKQQPLVVFVHEIDRWLLIYQGEKRPIKCLIADLQQDLQLLDTEIVVGETIVDFKDVSLSYDSALGSSQLHDFYTGKGIQEMEANDVAARGALPSISFVAFNKALSIRDFETVQAEITKIFDTLKKSEALPNYTRHIVFLIFIDLYRQFETVTEHFYQEHAEKIAISQNFEELQLVIEETITEIRAQKGKRQYSEHVQDVLAIIHNEYDQQLNLKDVANRLHMNTMYVGQLFKKETNKSFSQYLHQYRIKKAQNFLVDTSDTINEIADKTGYTSAGYFYKSFKKICGISPKEFREQYQSNFDPLE